MRKILVFFGTRPEAIKLAPVIIELRKYREFQIRVCVSAQHREMLDQVLKFFNITPDYDLNIMKPGQNLLEITTEALRGLHKVIDSCKPDWLVVQGDTTTTFIGALSAFYEKVKVAHIEAGLRSFDKHSPFPEEINRVLTTHLADLHFAPTTGAQKNLLRESVPPDSIFVVGNTSIDALYLCLKKLSARKVREREFAGIDFEKRIILITGHRRESFGKPFENICHALKAIADDPRTEIVYPVHLNPNVRRPVLKILKDIPNVHLIEPLDYLSFIWLMKKSHIVLTDSGGVQEEAPSLGRPVLVMRDVTERLEGVEAGTAKIVGTEIKRIVSETRRLLDDEEEYARMAKAVNPYGDGKASGRIAAVLQRA